MARQKKKAGKRLELRIEKMPLNTLTTQMQGLFYHVPGSQNRKK